MRARQRAQASVVIVVVVVLIVVVERIGYLLGFKVQAFSSDVVEIHTFSLTFFDLQYSETAHFIDQKRL